MSALIGAIMTIVSISTNNGNPNVHTTTQEYSSMSSCLKATEDLTNLLQGASQSNPVKSTIRGKIYYVGGEGVPYGNKSGVIQFICADY